MLVTILHCLLTSLVTKNPEYTNDPHHATRMWIIHKTTLSSQYENIVNNSNSSQNIKAEKPTSISSTQKFQIIALRLGTGMDY